jgi:hypothetical protein
MRTHLAAIVTILTLSVGGATSQQPPAAAPTNAARIAALIESLDAASFAERERATRDLLALQGAALEPLHKALASGRALEFRRRAQSILNALAIHEPGGEVVNGLKLRLTADRAAVKPGESIKLTTTLCNMTDRPLNVLVGYTTCGNYLECGSALRCVKPGALQATAEVEPKCQVGFCGTGAGPIYLTVPAKSVVSFETQAVLGSQPPAYTLGATKYFTVAATPGADVFRMTLSATTGHSPRPANPNQKGVGVRPADEDAPFWSGTVRSNDVRIVAGQ